MKRASVFYWLIGLTIAAILIVAAFCLDEAARNFIAQHQTAAAKSFMRNVSRFGDWPAHVAVGLALVGLAWLRGNKKWTRILLSMLMACAIAGVTARLIKIGTGRARPSVKTEEVWNGPRFSSKYHAFPSGHTAASSAFFAVLLIANWRIGLVFVPIPILIGLSRMYVAAHYLSDVVCAMALGVVCAILVAQIFCKIDNRQSTIGV